ncbi:MAG: replicative DNA helicase [Erysipelotrichaceae bacterium]|nr:replicative DNA helicase [Erysipelotrichaceae bacterium]
MRRELPHSNESEQSILGAMLIYPSVIQVASDLGLEKTDFYSDIHQRIFESMMDLLERGQPIDVTGLITRLQDTEQLPLVGGADYITKLADTAVSSANAHHYIELIRSRAHLRRLIETAEKIAEEGFDTSQLLDDIMDQAERDILQVTRSRRATEFKSSREVISNVMEEIHHLRTVDTRVTGVKTGYSALDNLTNGFQKGDLIILAARPAMGKTAFALNLGLNASFYNPGAIAIFSLEMPAESLMKRILSAKSEVESGKLRSGNINDMEYNRLCESANELNASKIFIDDSANVKVSEIFSKCRKLHSEHGLSMIIIDYLQLIRGSGRNTGDNRQQEVSEISRSLKGLAREMECPVIALSQLSRSVETRTDKRPMLSDLRESGAIEQDADIVMFLYREDYYDKDASEEEQEKDKIADLELAKHRNGATGRIQLVFRKSISAFFNLAAEF